MVADRSRPRAVVRFAPALCLAVAFAAGPFVADRATISLLALAWIYAIAALGVSVNIGFIGIVSLAQSAFFGVGAFSTAYVTTHLDGSGWTGAALGVAICVATAYFLGATMLRLEGHYLALGTLALAVIATVLFTQLDSITGGALGVGGVPRSSSRAST
jgi:branched-chain amino acid transport system permease protein